MGCAILLSPIVIASVWVHGFLYITQFATQWAAWFTIAAFLLIFYSARLDSALIAEKMLISADVEWAPVNVRASMQSTDPNQMLSEGIQIREERCTTVRGWASILQQIAITWQFCCCFVFWAFVAPAFLPVVTPIWQVGLILSHTLPIVLLLINYYMTDSVIRLKDWWQGFVLAVAYCTINYLFC
jgi:hypothetical protein